MAHSRHNKSTNANIWRTAVPFARGSFKNVWRGHYTDGPRRGRGCVSKIFNTGFIVFEDEFFELEMTVIEEAQKIIDAWSSAHIFDMPIMLSRPEIWTYEDTGERCLTEPFIHDFRKFNSNTGWVRFPGEQWSDVLQALSHFSYHHSGGERVLCDIQGGIYTDRL